MTDLLVFERECASCGARFIAGVDEAGRGPLAGPVTAAAVIMPLDDIIEGVNDSKKLSPKKRNVLYDIIREKAVAFAVECVDEKTIDKINILSATKLCMKRCLERLNVKPDAVLVDAVALDYPSAIIPIVKGDAKSYSIAAASILAKVYRDRLMEKFDAEYPEYGFSKHKGYGTKQHIEAIKKYGPCPIHRRTFIGNFYEE